jgi:DNA-binding NarL/FixJ family response regulator
MTVTVIIAHSQPHFRHILKNIVQSKEAFRVVGEAANAAELLQATAKLQPDVIIADIALPGMEGFALLRQLAGCCKQAKVIISWRYHDEPVVNEAIAAGCAGCMVHDAPFGDYAVAIKEVMKGNVFYCKQTENLVKAQANACKALRLLNEKQMALIHCTWIGFDSKETSVATQYKESTVKTYRKRFKNIIGSRSIAAFENFIKKHGLK